MYYKIIKERKHLSPTTRLIWKTFAPNAIYGVQTGYTTPPRQEHESQPYLGTNNDATFFPVNIDLSKYVPLFNKQMLAVHLVQVSIK